MVSSKHFIVASFAVAAVVFNTVAYSGPAGGQARSVDPIASRNAARTQPLQPQAVTGAKSGAAAKSSSELQKRMNRDEKAINRAGGDKADSGRKAAADRNQATKDSIRKMLDQKAETNRAARCLGGGC